jgi:SAM-dependent methyltransferase
VNHPNSLYTAPELYDAEFGGYRADVPFYRHVLETRPGLMVEAGCGTGRLYFLVEPPSYVGVDGSVHMLRRFSTRGRGHAPPLVAGNLMALPLKADAARVVVLAYNVLQHMMTPLMLKAALAEAGRVAPVVALDTFMPPLPGMVRRDEGFGYVEQRRHPAGHILDVAEQTEFDEGSQVQLTRLRFEGAEGGAPVHTVTRRLWSADALRSAITLAGLRVAELWGDVDATAWDDRAPRFMAVCERAS